MDKKGSAGASKRKAPSGGRGGRPASAGKGRPVDKKRKFDGKWKKDAAPKALSRQERKDLRKQRKAEKPHAEVTSQLNSMYKVAWTRLERKERASKVEEVLTQLRGKIAAVASKHDAARVLQVMMKHSQPKQRALIMAELKAEPGCLRTLSTHHYGHHVVLKLLQYGGKPARDAVEQEFHGHVVNIAQHVEGAKVLDYLYASSGRTTRRAILLQVFGPEFYLFEHGEYEAKGKDTSEKSNGDNASEEKKSMKPAEMGFMAEELERYPQHKASLLKNVRKFLNKIINKEMLIFRFVHTLIREYLEHANLRDAASLIDAMHGPVPALHHSRDGARALIHCLNFGSRKDNKALVKACKGSVVTMSLHEHGCWVIMRCLDTIDDRVLLQKAIVSELLAGMGELVDHPNGNRVLLHLLAPRQQSYFHPEECKILLREARIPENVYDSLYGSNVAVTPAASSNADGDTPSTTPIPATKEADVCENHSIYELNSIPPEEAVAAGMVKTHKKDTEVLRQEVLAMVQPTLLQQLCQRLGGLIDSSLGSRVLFEAVREAMATGDAPQKLEARKVLKAMADLVATSTEQRAAAAAAAEREAAKLAAAAKAEKDSIKAAKAAARAKARAAAEAEEMKDAGGDEDDEEDNMDAEDMEEEDSESDDEDIVAAKKMKRLVAGQIGVSGQVQQQLHSGKWASVENPIEGRFSHYVMKRLLLQLPPDDSTFLADALVKALESSQQTAKFACTNRGAFVIEALLTRVSPKVQDSFVKSLSKVSKEIKDKEDSAPGCSLLLKTLMKSTLMGTSAAAAASSAAAKSKTPVKAVRPAKDKQSPQGKRKQASISQTPAPTASKSKFKSAAAQQKSKTPAPLKKKKK